MCILTDIDTDIYIKILKGPSVNRQKVHYVASILKQRSNILGKPCDVK